MTAPADDREPDAAPDHGSGIDAAPRDPVPAADGGGSEAGRAAESAHSCDRCGAVMYERHCRIICPVCGYQRDCSDP